MVEKLQKWLLVAGLWLIGLALIVSQRYALVPSGDVVFRLDRLTGEMVIVNGIYTGRVELD